MKAVFHNYGVCLSESMEALRYAIENDLTEFLYHKENATIWINRTDGTWEIKAKTVSPGFRVV